MKRFWLTLLIILFLAVPGQAATVGSSGGGHDIQEDGGSLTQRPTLNFTGDGVTCSDVSSKTTCNIPISATGVPAANYYVAGNGNDGNACTSSGAPCLTIQAAINKIPQFFAGNTTLNIASDSFAETVTIEGYRPNGPYYLTIRGYINSTANSFTDVAAVGQYTSSGSNTANFPTDSLSLFKDTTNSPFTTADEEQLLYITGGASRCTDADDDYKNWYRINKRQSATQIDVVTRWDTCGTPILEPQITTTSTAATGGSLATYTYYYYRITATNANGETIPSAERSQLSDISGGNDETITINWGAVTGATGYKVYGRTIGAELLMATWNGTSWSAGSGTATSWTDTGSVTPSGALSLDNTTQTIPNNTTTYKIFRDANMATITGSNTRSYGMVIKDSSGIRIQNIKVTGAVLSGFYIVNSSIDRISGTVADSNYASSVTGTYWTGGYHFMRSYVGLMRANRGTKNYFQNYHFTEATQVNEFSENLSTYSYADAGIQFTQLTTVELVNANLSYSDSWCGMDFEYGSVLYRFQYNRVSNTLSSPINGGGLGLAVATNSAVNFTRRNSFNNNATHGILLYGQSKLEYNSVLIPNASVIEVKNNGGYGIMATKLAMCISCSGWTNTGNTSGQYYYDYVFDYTNKRLGVGLGMVTDTTPDADLHIKSASAREYIESTGNSNYAATVYFTKGGSGTQRTSSIYAQGNETVADSFISLSGDNATFQLTVMYDGKVHIGSNCTDPDAAFEIGGTGTGCNTGTGSYINAGSTAFSVNSSRDIKTNFKLVYTPDILKRILNIPVYIYDFKDGVRLDKMGLIAEDFYTIFERGSDKRIDGDEQVMALWIGLQALIRENEVMKEKVKYLCSFIGGCP